jgi:predicted NUDIX family NTP pyrophosphohydrolase
MIYRKSRKQVHCFAGPAPAGAAPRTASWEVDKAEFLPLTKAREVIHPDQAVFLDRLEELLGGAGAG